MLWGLPQSVDVGEVLLLWSVNWPLVLCDFFLDINIYIITVIRIFVNMGV